MHSGATFHVMGISEVPSSTDGPHQPDAFRVEVDVSGVLYEVRIRKRHFMARLPEKLVGHPLAAQIKAAAIDRVFQGLNTPVNKARRGPGMQVIKFSSTA